MNATEPDSVSVRNAAILSAAIGFLAQDGRADRALAVHHDERGRCGCCSMRWPCGIARLAIAARDTTPVKDRL